MNEPNVKSSLNNYNFYVMHYYIKSTGSYWVFMFIYKIICIFTGCINTVWLGKSEHALDQQKSPHFFRFGLAKKSTFWKFLEVKVQNNLVPRQSSIYIIVWILKGSELKNNGKYIALQSETFWSFPFFIQLYI